MLINVLPSLILPTFISRPVCNCCEVDRPTVCLVKQRPLFHKMYILKLIKHLVPLVLLVLNGAIPLLKRNLKDHLQLMDGEVDLLKSILLSSHPIPTSNAQQIVDQFHLLHEFQVLDKSNK